MKNTSRWAGGRSYLLGLRESGKVLAWRGKLDYDEGLLRVVQRTSEARRGCKVCCMPLRLVLALYQRLKRKREGTLGVGSIEAPGRVIDEVAEVGARAPCLQAG